MPKLIQVNEGFWVSTDQIHSVKIDRSYPKDPFKPELGMTKEYVWVALKEHGNDSFGAGFTKHLGKMWGATADEQANNFTTEANRPDDFGLARSVVG